MSLSWFIYSDDHSLHSQSHSLFIRLVDSIWNTMASRLCEYDLNVFIHSCFACLWCRPLSVNLFDSAINWYWIRPSISSQAADPTTPVSTPYSVLVDQFQNWLPKSEEERSDFQDRINNDSKLSFHWFSHQWRAPQSHHLDSRMKPSLRVFCLPVPTQCSSYFHLLHRLSQSNTENKGYFGRIPSDSVDRFIGSGLRNSSDSWVNTLMRLFAGENGPCWFAIDVFAFISAGRK